MQSPGQEGDAASRLPKARNERLRHFNGAMEELSGKVQKASTHAGSVGVDAAASERNCATPDVDATSRLPHKEGFGQFQKASTPLGQWRKCQGEFNRRALTLAVLE